MTSCGRGRDFLCTSRDFLKSPGISPSGRELFRRVGFAVGRLAFPWQGWGFLREEQPFRERPENFREDGRSPRGRPVKSIHCPQRRGLILRTTQSTGGTRLGRGHRRCSPGPHPAQRRHGRQPAWPAAGTWHPPRVGSDGVVGGRPVSRCCDSTPQKGLGAGDSREGREGERR